VVGCAIVVLAAAGITYIWSANKVVDATAVLAAAEESLEEKQAAERVAANQAATREREREAQEQQDSYWASVGYSKATDGLYYRFRSEGEYSCGTWNCAVVDLSTAANGGCPSGAYVEAALMVGGTAIGMTNGVAAAMANNSSASVLLQDAYGTAESFEIRKINCY